MAETIEEKASVQAECVQSPMALVSALSGPVLAVLVWLAPLPVTAAARHTLAIVVFMTAYWVATPVDYGITALIGCYFFWALHIVTFPVAFSGFANSTPWFLFGAILMGEAASNTGLARRIGFSVIQLVGTSYACLLLGLLLFVFILNFMVPSGLAQLAITAPIAIGIIDAFGASRHSNIAVGLFIMISYT
ncbi:MAG: SLC13 family permease, partial [Terriglobia bacterium]